jgi:hypothetical protein
VSGVIGDVTVMGGDIIEADLTGDEMSVMGGDIIERDWKEDECLSEKSGSADGVHEKGF